MLRRGFFTRRVVVKTPIHEGEGFARRMLGWLAERARQLTSALGWAVLSPYTRGTSLADLSGDRSQPIKFGSDTVGGYSSELIATLGLFRGRLRLFRTIVLLVRTGLLVLALAFVFRLLDLLGTVRETDWLPYALLTVLVVGVGLAVAQHISYLEVARVVDRQLGLKAQLGTAVELTLEGQPTILARSQVRQATTIVRRLSVRQAVSPRAPWSDIRLASLAVAGLLALSFLDTIGLHAAQSDLTNQAALEALDPSLNAWYDLDPQLAAERSQGSPGAFGLQTAVDRLKEQLKRPEISPDEYARQVGAIEDSIRQQAQESARQQAALADLAESLADTSSTRSIAESLNRGDYAEAVRGLADLAGQTDRLSEQARQDLADRLEEVARNAAASNDGLASAAERAAQALRAGDRVASEQALRDLASEVAEASEKVAPQSDLGEALAEAQQAQGEHGSDGNGQAGEGVEPGGAESGPGQYTGGQGPSASTGGPSTAGAQGSGAGTGRGERIASGDPSSQPLKPDAEGKTLQITGRAGGSGSRVRGDASTNAPVVPTSAATTTIQSGGARSTEQVNASGEVNNVPLDLRSIVRDYFTGSDQP